MSSSPPSPVPLPSQETFERVFSLQRRVEPDHENHITSSFSVLDINDNNNNTLALGIYPSRSKKPLLAGKNTTTAQSESVYNNKGNLACLSLASTGCNLDHNNLALLSSTTPQENYYPLARDSIAIWSDSRVKNELPGNTSNPSTPKPPSPIYSHYLLQPIYVPVIRGPENRWSYQENRHP